MLRVRNYESPWQEARTSHVRLYRLQTQEEWERQRQPRASHQGLRRRCEWKVSASKGQSAKVCPRGNGLSLEESKETQKRW